MILKNLIFLKATTHPDTLKNAFRISPRNAPHKCSTKPQISRFIDLSSFACPTYYSFLKLFTGFANAALIAWKLMVVNAIIMAASPPAANNHQLIWMR